VPLPASGAYASALKQYASGDYAAVIAAVEAAGAAASQPEQLLLRRARLAAASAASAAAACAAADADASRLGASPLADARGRVDTPSQLLAVRALVAALSPPAAGDNDDDASDVAAAPGGATMQLLALAQALQRGGEAAQALFRGLEVRTGLAGSCPFA
jgi:hypothetical protein